MVDEWIAWVHMSITSLKYFLLGTFQDTIKLYLQNYLNKLYTGLIDVSGVGGAEIPNRLMRSCVDCHLN
jgi:hypothetical protein